MSWFCVQRHVLSATGTCLPLWEVTRAMTTTCDALGVLLHNPDQQLKRWLPRLAVGILVVMSVALVRRNDSLGGKFSFKPYISIIHPDLKAILSKSLIMWFLVTFSDILTGVDFLPSPALTSLSSTKAPPILPFSLQIACTLLFLYELLPRFGF